MESESKQQNFIPFRELESPEEATPVLSEFQDTDYTENTVSSDIFVECMREGGNVICSSAAATRIHKTIVTSLLPQLHNILTHKVSACVYAFIHTSMCK